MKTLNIHIDVRKTVLAGVLLLALAFVGSHARTYAAAGACTAPSTDYGTVTSTVSITGAGTYRVWTRLAAPDTTNNTYKLEIDGNQCYTIGGSTVPVFTSTQDTNGNRFLSTSANWFAKDTTGAFIDVSLTAANHTFKLIGNAPGVVVDRLVLTQDTTCTPTGTGDNCANPPDTTKPTVSITSPANGANISATTTVTANAIDDVAMSKVEFYVDGVLKGTDTTASSNNFTYSFNPASFTVGSHTIYAIAYDTSNNSQTSATITVNVLDTTPPTISAVTVSSITQTSATVTWTTNETADSQVKYGTTTSYGQTTTLNTSLVTSHSVNVTGLTAGTLYHYQVVSKDSSGNSANSADATFTTQSAGGDTTPPTVSITAPASGTTVNGTTTLTANASDNVGVVGVQFKVDGANVGAEDTAAPYSISWTPTVFSGTHTITAVARDAAGNTTTATSVSITVTVKTADINVDGSVNFLDLSSLASNYGKSGAAISPTRTDINGDGTVNFLDLSALASQYGT
jgi:hypothetical protein